MMLIGQCLARPIFFLTPVRDAQFYATFAQTEEVEQMELQDFVAQGDQVIVFGHYKGRVKSTGRSYTKDFIHAVKLRDGQVVRFREYVASDDMHAAFTNKL